MGKVDPLSRPEVKEVLRHLTAEPRPFMVIVTRVCTKDGPTWRAVDGALQKLRRAGLALYLKKADGGPGWVKVEK